VGGGKLNYDAPPFLAGFYFARHTFATRAKAHQFDDKSLSELLGHSSVRFTLEKYVHSSIETKRASMERFVACY